VAQPSFDRAGAKAAGYSDAEIDAYLAQQQGASAAPSVQRVASESTAVTPRPAVSPNATDTPDIGLGGNIVGMTRAAMNKLTFGQYPRIVGAATSLVGGDGEAEAKKLAGYLAAYKQASPKAAGVAEFAGEVAPYFAGGPIPKMIGKAASATPAIAKALQSAGSGYKAARAALPLGTKVLPASARTAAQIAGIEGLRGASEAEEGESPLAGALKSATIAMPFGRFGEVAGTYVAGKFGKSIDKMSAEANTKAQKAGEIINQWRDIGQLPVTQQLATLYSRSKPLREAVDEFAESLGLPATDPKVLTEAYSKLSAEGSPVFKKEILRPFLSAIDQAAQPLVGKAKVSPLSKGIRDYAEAMDVEKAITAGRQTGEYLRTGAGAPEKVGGEVLTERMGRPYVSQAERDAAAQALIASIRESNTATPSTLRGAGMQAARTLLTGGPRGVGDIADFSARIGQGTRGQRMAQRAGAAIGASR